MTFTENVVVSVFLGTIIVSVNSNFFSFDVDDNLIVYSSFRISWKAHYKWIFVHGIFTLFALLWKYFAVP